MARILLVGAGHAHLPLLARADRVTGAGHHLGLISPSPFRSCLRVAGQLAGALPDQGGTALSLLAPRGVHLFEDAVIGIDAKARLVHRHEGPPLAYDILSLNIGSLPRPLPGTDNHPRCFAPKPFARLAALREALRERFQRHPGRPVALVIAGGGLTAVELAAAILALAARCGGHVAITLLTRGRLLTQLPEKAAIRAIELLAAHGTILQEMAPVARVEENEAVLANGDRIAFDLFLNATGLVPPPLAGVSGLPVDAVGAVRVDDFFRVEGQGDMVAAGDCATAPGPALAQGHILARNLQALANGRPLRALSAPRPRHRLELGDAGLAHVGRFWWMGRSALWLKRRRDAAWPG